MNECHSLTTAGKLRIMREIVALRQWL